MDDHFGKVVSAGPAVRILTWILNIALLVGLVAALYVLFETLLA